MRLLPPRSKKSASGSSTSAPRRSVQSSCTQAAVPSSCRGRTPLPTLGRGPRQGVAVDLARGPGLQRVHDDQPGNERRRHGGSEVCHGGPGVERRIGRDVADQDAVAGPGGADGGSRAGDAREREQRAVDLPELDAATTELDLVVGPAQEDQALVVVPDQVAAAVRAVPPERGHRRELLPVQVGVEVAREADPADDQLTAASDLPTGAPAASTTARSQPSSGSPIRTGPSPVRRAAHETTVASVGP